MPFQIASVLPAPKVVSTGLQAKGVFSATLRGLLVTPDSTKADPGATGAWPSKLTQLDTNFGADWPGGGPIGKPIGQTPLSSEEAQTGSSFPGTSHPQVTDLREQIEGPTFPQLGWEGAAITKGPLPGPPVESSGIERSGSQSAVQQKLPQMTVEQNDLTRCDLVRQPNAMATPHRTASIPDASPHTSRKAKAIHDKLRIAADQPSDMATPVAQLSDFVFSVARLQPDGSQPDASRPSSNAVAGHIRSRSPSGRAPVQTIDTRRAAASSNSLATLGTQASARSGATLAADDEESLRRPMSVFSDYPRGSQSAPLSREMANSTAVGPASPPLQSKAAHSIAESDDRTALPMNSRILKDTEGTTGAELKSEAKLGTPPHSALGPAAVEHPPVPIFTPAIPHGTEKGIATHRPEVNAAQMLQKMDMAASPGVMQLRADARRLDVGVSSSTLGWVEVRATTGPSGRIDATLQTQNDASAHVLAKQSTEISSYAREHSVQLGQVSVGVGTGESRQGESRNHGGRDQIGPRTQGLVQSRANTEQANHADDAVSLINVRV
jgi:hypothetical protein